MTKWTSRSSGADRSQNPGLVSTKNISPADPGYVPKEVLEPSRLKALIDTGLLDSPAEIAFDRMVDLVCQLLDVPVALVSLVDRNRQYFKAARGLPEVWDKKRETPLTHSFCKLVVGNKKRLIVHDAHEDEMVCNNLAVRDLGVRSYLGMPLRTASGHVIGSLCAIDSNPRVWTEQDLRGLQSLAAAVMTELAVRQQLVEIKQYAADLQRSNEELERFAVVASHDLRQPLQTITSYTEILRDRLNAVDDVDGCGLLDHVTHGVSRMSALIGDLLQLSKAGQQEMNVGIESANEIVSETVLSLGAEIAEVGALVTWDDLPQISADKGLVGLVFQNLFANAIKFRSDSPARVHVSAVSSNGTVEFAVTDNGIGIEEEAARSIFDVFDRAHSGEDYEGSGIGLAICLRIVERHGGDMHVESAVGEGSTFRFSLPAARRA